MIIESKNANAWLNKPSVSYIVCENMKKIRECSPYIRNFFNILDQLPKQNVAVFGGAIRDWYCWGNPKDIDIVLDAPQEIIDELVWCFPHQKSPFGGCKFNLDGIEFDAWLLQDSWYIKTICLEPTWMNLLRGAPFYTDAILVKMDGTVEEIRFFDYWLKGEIELLNMNNKDDALIINRAYRFKKKYGWKFGPLLKEFIKHNTNWKNGLLKIGPVEHVSSN